MKKAELINEISTKTGLTKGQCDAVLKAFVEVTVDALKKDDKIALKGLGTFSVSQRKERIGRSPRTGETVTIPARKVATFKASSSLKDELN